jgi:transposase
MKKFTFNDFNQQFPNDSACLEWLFNRFYPNDCKKCGKPTKHHRVKSRPSYSCDFCGNHVHPTADTIFHKSSTSLRLWFYAIYLMASTRAGISAKQLERELGVTYKTAWRMFTQIRKMMGDDNTPLGGVVEVDETYIGGKERGKGMTGLNPASKKTPVMGMVERGGRVKTKVIDKARLNTVTPIVRGNVEEGSWIMSDEARHYWLLHRLGYNHQSVNHQKTYVMGEVHTNTIEGFWSQLKNGIKGVYKHVDAKYLGSYVDEYAFRYSHRKDSKPMFLTLLGQIRA